MIAGMVGGPTVYEAALGRLDATLRAKYDGIMDAADDLVLAARAAFSQWEDVHQRLMEARTAHAAAEHAEAHSLEVGALKRAGKYTPGVRLTSAASALARAEERAQARLRERDRVTQLSADALAVARAVEALVSTADPADLQPVLVPRPTSSTATDLVRVRELLAVIDKEARAVVVAPRPLDEAHAALDRFLDTVAAEYDPPVNAFAMPNHSSTPAPDSFTPYKLSPLLASLPPFRDLLHEKLTAAYRALPAALSDEDRAATARTLVERREKLERAEEALILGGTGFSRRHDASARIVLCTLLQT